jgi:hypothetical protein
VYSLVNLCGFPGILVPVGTHAFTHIDITMDRGKAVDVQWGWIDTTGLALGIRKRYVGTHPRTGRTIVLIRLARFLD